MYENYRREDIEDHIHKIGFHPLDVMVTGATGAGKSSTLNSFFDKVVAKVGEGVDPETMEIQEYQLDNLRIFDSPGLGDGKERDIAHSKKIVELLHRRDANGNALIDLVLVIVDGSTRDLGTTYELIENVIIPSLGEERHNRLLIAVNQADVAMKGKHWDSVNCRPDEVLTAFLNDKVRSIRERIQTNTGITVNPIFYKFFVKANAFTASSACIGCGQCVKRCPMNNVTFKDGKPVWGKACTHCMACICYCPVSAIEYGKKSVGQPRYHFEAL